MMKNVASWNDLALLMYGIFRYFAGDLGDLLWLRGLRWGFATRGQGGNLAAEDKSGKFATSK